MWIGALFIINNIGAGMMTTGAFEIYIDGNNKHYFYLQYISILFTF
jgi:hypothetical protein